jgi:cold shock CspA family protein
MRTGTICDLDAQGGFGLIEADDGHIVCFNRTDIAEKQAAELHVGTRVAFLLNGLAHDAHIAQLKLSSADSREN